jgi:NitT/TauT family transport system ATP-binding protein
VVVRPHVEIRDAVITYVTGRDGSGLQTIGPLCLDIDAGAVMTLVGPSGCGKTSLLNALAGLVPLASGEMLIHGRPVTGPGTDRAVVFQDYALLPWRTVWDNVSFGLDLAVRRTTAGDVRSRVAAARPLGGHAQ